MKKLLYINACIRKEHSRTQQIASELLKELSARYKVEEINLADTPLRALDAARYQQRSLGNYDILSIEYARQFAAADRIVVACPFWDMSFPSVFKIFCENISINGITFGDRPDGTTSGMCNAKKNHVDYNKGYGNQ